MYGGIEKFDAGKFYHDSLVISEFSKIHPLEYFKLLFGFQNDMEGSFLYEKCIVNTDNWDNGKVKDFFYNDNRILIRLHTLLNFVPFSNYFIQALFDSFLSFIGLTYIYKSIKSYFEGKEIWVLLILCTFPALWFYTGAVLKEGITLFVFGCTLYLIKKTIYAPTTFKTILLLFAFLFISFLLKPYILVLSTICFTLFFAIQKSNKIQSKVLFFISVLLLCFGLINSATLIFKNKSLLVAAKERQRQFADVSKGGIFLLDSVKFVRLTFDTTQVNRVPLRENLFKIKEGVSYSYWEHSHQKDTLYCAKNTDTTTHYSLVYQIAESGSNFSINTDNVFSVVGSCLYYSLFYPLFYHSKGILQLLASFENLIIIISLVLILFGLVQNKKDNFLPILFLIIAFIVSVLIGFTTPNSGAIFRYRSPIVIFILLAALYYINIQKLISFKKRT